MDWRICICAIFVLVSNTEERVTRDKRSQHVPPSFVPTFRRDSVERVPDVLFNLDRSSPFKTDTSLPLRSAVESIPDIIQTSRRLPLRDAVERRPPPDEPFDPDLDTEVLTPSPQRRNPLEKYGIYEGIPSFQGGYPYNLLPNGVISSNIPKPSFYYSQNTFYSPLQAYKNLLGDFRTAAPYRVDNGFQTLYTHNAIPRGRSLYPSNPFFRKGLNEEENVNDNVGDKRIVCYIQGAAAYRKEPLTFTPEDLDPFACTHVIYAFASIDPHTYNMISNDDEFDIVQGGYRAVSGLKRLNPKLKVLISVGEARQDSSNRFTIMVSSAAKRRDFIRSVITFIETYNFDGLDIAWEYPGAEELGGHVTDKEHLNLFLEEISEIFKSRGWLLTLSAPASRFRIEDGFTPGKLSEVVDFVNVKAYDFHKDRDPVADHHSNLNNRPEDSGLNIFLSVDYAVHFWLKRGLPRSKLVLGLPFFGRSFTLQYPNETDIGAAIKGPGREGFYTQTPGLLAYFEICDLVLNEGWYRNEDSVGSPYIVNGDQWVGYDDPESLQRKINYVKENQLGGVTIWSADLDDFKGLCGEKWPLLNAVNRHLKGTASPLPFADYSPPTKPYGTCISDGFYSDPKNCAAYYICKNTLSYHLSCGEKMMFDPNTGRCDYMGAEKCRPGQSVYIHNNLKEIDNALLRVESVKDNRPKVVCYMTNWAFYRKGDGKFVPEHIDQTLCTHVIYAFASLDPEKLLTKEFDPWADLDNNLYERVTSLQDTKVMLSLGGWTDSAGDKYSRLVSDGSARRRFVVGVIGFLRRHGFKGLHFDWNYPVCWQSNCRKGPASDKANFAKLVQELRKEFDKQQPPLILAAAISGYKEVIDVAYDLASLGRTLDFMSVMTYDYHGAWERQTGHVSPLYGQPGDKYPQYNTNYTMEYLVNKGAPREKLLVGIPFYGQTFTLSKPSNYGVGIPSAGPGEPGEYTKQPGMLAYYEICNRIRNNRWIVNRDPTGPYAHSREQWVGFEDDQSVRQKADYIKSNGFGGAVAWTIDLDDFSNRCCGGTYPLLRNLNQALGRVSTIPAPGDCTKPPAPSTPAPPITTTGIDSGASSSEHNHGEWTTEATKPTTTSPWWTSTQSTTSSPWWTSTTTKRPTTTIPWWQSTTTTSTSRPSTTPPVWERPQSTTPPSWEYPPGTTIPPPAVIMPEVDKPSKECETGQYLPDTKNCNAYYRCILGELKKQYCAGGLHWNRVSGICDWPSSAKCVEESSSVTARPPKPQTTYQSWQTKTTPNYVPSTTTQPSTTVSTSQLQDGVCTNGQYYPHESCGSFYVCVNNQLLGQSCAPGLSWNPDDGICDWSFRIDCNGRKKLSEKYTNFKNDGPQPYSSCTENTFSVMPGDCTQYMQCLWGKYEVFQCGAGLHWNSATNTCDWPSVAKCTENGIDGVPPSVHPKPTTRPTSRPETTTYPAWKPESTTQWRPPSTTTENAGSNWEWHPPIPPTSEQPPLSEELKPQSGYFKVVCYFTNWAWYRRGLGKYLPEDIHPDLCTHIVYGFAVLDFENLIIKAHDSWADFDNQFYKRVVAFKEKGVKVSIAIGGWNDSQGDKYSRLVNNPGARARFISNVVAFIEKWGFDGLDLDWEYPKCWQVDCKKGPDSDKPAFASFVMELSAAFKPKGLLLSAAVSPSKTVIDAGYDVPALAAGLDWVAVMTYDFHGQWDKQTGHVAPLYYHEDDAVAFYNSNYSINYWISEGVPRRKIVMGMPLYGQSFRLENEAENGLNAKAPGPGEAGEFTRAAGFLAYYEICDNIKNKGWTVVKDPKRRMGPYAYKGNEWVSYDDQEMIRIKSEYIRKMDLGGGMIWALDLDDFKNRCGDGRHPLLTIIRNVLADKGTGIAQVPQASENAIETRPELMPIVVDPDDYPPTDFSAFDDGNKVVCYFTNWAWHRQGSGKYYPNNIDPQLCTHIVYATAVLDQEQLIIKPLDTWTDIDNKFYEKVTGFRSKGIKVLLSLGGFTDSATDKYSKLVNNPSSRRKFAAHVVDFLKMHNFDGLDLNWQYPKCWQSDCGKGPDSDKPAFTDFVRELSIVLRPERLLLSVSVSPSVKIAPESYDIPALSRYASWINLMAKDFHGEWEEVTGHVAPMYARPEDRDQTSNTNYTVNWWINNGVDRSKLILSIPLYGNTYTLADPQNNGLYAPTVGSGEAGEQTKTRGFLAYYEICNNIQNKDWTMVRDRKGRIGPYAYNGNQWVAFDDIGMIRHKSEYIKAMALGGSAVWALDLDDFKNECNCEEYPLLKTINRVLRNYPSPAPKCVLGKPSNRPQRPTTIPTTTYTPPTHPVIVEEPNYVITPVNQTSCLGRVFMPSHNCNEYYLCDQGQLLLQMCPGGLFWNKDHCDWPENTLCHPDAITEEPPVAPVTPPQTQRPEIVTVPSTNRPSLPGTTSPPGDYKVVCYFTNWAWYRQGDGKYLPSDIDASLCTHIAYGFAVLDPNTLTLKPHDTWADIDNDFYTKVTALRSKGVKVLIALGGWNDSLGNKYSRLVNDPSARQRFIQNVIQFIEKWGFDGLDLDWEYPKCWQVDCNKGPASDKEGFAAWVAELSAAFKPRGWLLSAAVSPSKAVIDAGYDVPALSNYLDWIAVMTYDFHGHWDKQTGHVAPLYYYPGDTYDYFNANFSINYWIEKGAAPNKVVMGMPLYGQSFSLADTSKRGLNEKTYGPGEAGDFTRAGGFLAFYEICERVKRSGWEVVRDPLGRIGPYAYRGNQWVSYDDVSEIKRKSQLVKDLGLGGGMIWALDLDDFRNKCGCGKHPLLKTLNKELRGLPVGEIQDCT